MHVQQDISVITTFADRRHADHFVAELRRAGFQKNEIEVHYPHGRGEDIEEVAVAGAITGGMVGALVGLGVPEEKARQHEEEFLAGRTLVIVQAVGRGGKALAILRRSQQALGIRVPPTLTGFLKKLWRGRRSAATYRTEGETCLAHGEYDEAVRDFDEAIRLDPHNATAHLDRGLAYEEEGQYQEAISDYDVALRLDPNNAPAYFHRGNAWFALDEFDQAIHDYTDAIRLDPTLAAAYYHRGFAHQEKGHADQAKADHETALRLAPELADE